MNKQENSNSAAIKVLLSVFGVLVVGAIVVGVLLGLEITRNPEHDDYAALRQSEPPALVQSDSEDTQNNDMPVSAASTITYNGKTYQKNENIVNLLFLGIDTDEARRAQNLGYRSDVVMVCAIDTISKSATLISIPRDTYTTMYKIDEHTGKINQTVQDKINAAYAFGGRSYRAANSMACVQMFLQRENQLIEPLGFTLDIPVYLYASIDMGGIPALADAVGGVEVTLDVTIPRLDHLPAVGRKGETVTLKGDKAHNYLRNRNVASGDFGRAARQQTFMLALAKKIKSMGAVDIIVSLYTDLQRYAKTNLSTDQMIVFAKLLKQVDIDNIQKLSVTGSTKTMGGSSVIMHNEQETLEMLLDVYYSEV